MNNSASLKLTDLLSRTSSIAEKITLEEDRYDKALKNNLAAEQIEEIKNRLNLLKRKHALFTQAAKMVQTKG